MAEFEIKDIGHPHQFPETENRGYGLCDDGCVGHAGDTHLKAGNEDDIQNNIQDSCHQKVDQCRDGIAESAKDSTEDIIIGTSHAANHQNDQIRGTPVNDGIRRMEHLQKRP